MLHVGAGIARREADHERRRVERAQLEAHEQAALRPAAPATVLVHRVPASSIEVDEAGPNYAAAPSREAPSKRRRRRLQEEATPGSAAWLRGAIVMVQVAEDAPPLAETAAAAPQGRAADCERPRTSSGRRRSTALNDALAELEDRGEEGVDASPLPQLLAPHSYDTSNQLRTLRRKLRVYLSEQAEQNHTVSMLQGEGGALYPTKQWTVQFGKWLAATRFRESRADDWDEKAWRDPYQRRTTQGDNTTYVAIQHLKNHLWREIWPAMPMGGDAREYWHDVTTQVMSLFDGGGGGMLQAAALVEQKTMAGMRRPGISEAQLAAAGLEARKETLGALRATTARVCQKEHLYQVGEYQLQDGFLSNPFEVNASNVMNAYSCFTRVTGPPWP